MQPIATSHIETRPGKCGGKPCIRVQDIYAWHVLGGQSAVDILANHPELSLATIHAAISYVFDHREDIEQALADENANRKLHNRVESQIGYRKHASDRI